MGKRSVVDNSGYWQRRELGPGPGGSRVGPDRAGERRVVGRGELEREGIRGPGLSLREGRGRDKGVKGSRRRLRLVLVAGRRWSTAGPGSRPGHPRKGAGHERGAQGRDGRTRWGRETERAGVEQERSRWGGGGPPVDGDSLVRAVLAPLLRWAVLRLGGEGARCRVLLLPKDREAPSALRSEIPRQLGMGRCARTQRSRPPTQAVPPAPGSGSNARPC